MGNTGVFIGDIKSFLAGVGLELTDDLGLLTELDLGLSFCTVRPSNSDTMFGLIGAVPELLLLVLLLLKEGGVSRDLGADENVLLKLKLGRGLVGALATGSGEGGGVISLGFGRTGILLKFLYGVVGFGEGV